MLIFTCNEIGLSTPSKKNSVSSIRSKRERHGNQAELHPEAPGTQPQLLLLPALTTHDGAPVVCENSKPSGQHAVPGEAAQDMCVATPVAAHEYIGCSEGFQPTPRTPQGNINSTIDKQNTRFLVLYRHSFILDGILPSCPLW